MIYELSPLTLLLSDLRGLLDAAYTEVESIIDVAGDGDVPASALPYQTLKQGASLEIVRDTIMTTPIKWSNVKDTLVGLRQWMILMGHRRELGFSIVLGESEYLSYGRVLGGIPVAVTSI